MEIPNESDTFSVEYSDDKGIVNGKIHLSNADDINYHVMDMKNTELFGTGLIKFLTDDKILIITPSFNNLSLKKKN